MRTRFVTIMITIALLIPAVSPAYATSAAVSAILEDKAVYHTEESDYIAGDCVLTATRIMIRRAAIMNNDDDWKDITNASLRPDATEEGLMHNSFSYSDNGITYRISSGSFNEEDTSARAGEFAEILKKHPEGIVVYGENAASSGTHGVLVVKVKSGEIYAADASSNMGDMNMGIQKWKDTTMLDPSLCTDYWYISDISGGVAQAADEPDMPGFNLIRPDTEYM